MTLKQETGASGVSFEYSAGGIVYRRAAGQIELLLIQDRFGWWTMPKGHIEPGETPRQAAEREVLEETGVRAQVVADLPAVHYVFWQNGSRIDKFVHCYLMTLPSDAGAPVPQLEEIRKAAWVSIDRLDDLPQYGNNQPVIRAAIHRIEQIAASTPGNQEAAK